MSKFVINLSTESRGCYRNEYGYWTGKTYVVQGDKYPICEREITTKTKKYSNRKRAESMAGKLFCRCEHVNSWSIENC